MKVKYYTINYDESIKEFLRRINLYNYDNYIIIDISKQKYGKGYRIVSLKSFNVITKLEIFDKHVKEIEEIFPKKFVQGSKSKVFYSDVDNIEEIL